MECPICLEENDEESRITCCINNHVFHKKCILEWIKKKPNCPLCREPYMGTYFFFFNETFLQITDAITSEVFAIPYNSIHLIHMTSSGKLSISWMDQKRVLLHLDPVQQNNIYKEISKHI
jgi:hypothetical protein